MNARSAPVTHSPMDLLIVLLTIRAATASMGQSTMHVRNASGHCLALLA